MTGVDPAIVARAAALARLDIEPDAMQTLVEQIGRILEYVSQVEAVEREGDEGGDPSPWTSAPPRLRSDEPRRGPHIDLAALTEVDRGLVVVPRPPGMD